MGETGCLLGDFDQRGTLDMIMSCIRCGEMARTDSEPFWTGGPHQHVFEREGARWCTFTPRTQGQKKTDEVL